MCTSLVALFLHATVISEVTVRSLPAKRTKSRPLKSYMIMNYEDPVKKCMMSYGHGHGHGHGIFILATHPEGI